MWCVFVFVCVLLSAGQGDNRWPPVRSHQVDDLSLQPAGPAHRYQHHKLSVESSGVWIISHTHTHSCKHSTTRHIKPCHTPGIPLIEELQCFPPSSEAQILAWNFLPSCHLDSASKSEYRSAPVPILYPAQLSCVFLIRSSFLPWRQQGCSPRVTFKHTHTGDTQSCIGSCSTGSAAGVSALPNDTLTVTITI